MILLKNRKNIFSKSTRVDTCRHRVGILIFDLKKKQKNLFFFQNDTTSRHVFVNTRVKLLYI
jgi:hypothetical protein